jgi:phage N-6-adenine-methyltransferase
VYHHRTEEAHLDTPNTKLTLFRPEEARPRQVAHQAVIDLCAKLGDWQRVEAEIDAKLDDQEDVVNWWRETVRGKGKRSNSADRGYFVEQAEQLTGISHQQISRWAKKLGDRMAYRAAVLDAAYRKAMAREATHVSHNSGENEWYTPCAIIERARAAMGTIDCDPASCEFANRNVKATTYYTLKDDGLTKPWHGAVWLNPPYAQPACAQFCETAARKFAAQEIEQACLLVNNATETTWFQGALRISSAVCFLTGRIRYLDQSGQPANSPLQGQALLYFGLRIDEFRNAFDEAGIILRRV